MRERIPAPQPSARSLPASFTRTAASSRSRQNPAVFLSIAPWLFGNTQPCAGPAASRGAATAGPAHRQLLPWRLAVGLPCPTAQDTLRLIVRSSLPWR